MCQRVTCQQCGKPTFAGCGRHIEQVLGDVPREQRCRCREMTNTTATVAPSEPAGVPNTVKSWWK